MIPQYVEERMQYYESKAEIVYNILKESSTYASGTSPVSAMIDELHYLTEDAARFAELNNYNGDIHTKITAWRDDIRSNFQGIAIPMGDKDKRMAYYHREQSTQALNMLVAIA